MTHAARTHATWVSVLIVVAATVSYMTWQFVPRIPKGIIVDGTSVAKMLQVHQSASSTAWGLLRVKGLSENDHLTWNEENTDNNLIILDQSKQWISVKERGIYLIYLQVTFGLAKGNDSIDLNLIVDYCQTANGTEEFIAAFDTRKLIEKEQDAHLSTFFLLNMEPKQNLSVRTNSKEMVKYSDTEPFSNYFTIIRYAD